VPGAGWRRASTPTGELLDRVLGPQRISGTWLGQQRLGGLDGVVLDAYYAIARRRSPH
jgi:hypothetical protein